MYKVIVNFEDQEMAEAFATYLSDDQMDDFRSSGNGSDAEDDIDADITDVTTVKDSDEQWTVNVETTSRSEEGVETEEEDEDEPETEEKPKDGE